MYLPAFQLSSNDVGGTGLIVSSDADVLPVADDLLVSSALCSSDAFAGPVDAERAASMPSGNSR